MDTTTEFEISERVADRFAVKIRRPDKEDSIRIEPMADAPQGRSEERSQAPRREPRDAEPRSDKKKKHRDKPGHAGPPPSVTPWPAKGAPGKKAKKKRRG
jgi:ATP-dependent RNA helicase DeaD